MSLNPNKRIPIKNTEVEPLATQLQYISQLWYIDAICHNDAKTTSQPQTVVEITFQPQTTYYKFKTKLQLSKMEIESERNSITLATGYSQVRKEKKLA